MFKRILIANRGEIACRIIKTARRMGIETVAVYSEADRDALHVEMADEAVLIGPPAAAESYLVHGQDRRGLPQDRRGSRASRLRLFVRARSLSARAEKGRASSSSDRMPARSLRWATRSNPKKAAAKADVSTVPGFLGVIHRREACGEDRGRDRLSRDDQGLRRRRRQGHADRPFDRQKSPKASPLRRPRPRRRSATTASSSKSSLSIPCHIEIQVLGDKHGNVIYLGERECSIQRRNQKVIEEAPSPLLDETTRRKMGEQAVALARAVKYDFAGTVEFVAGQDKSFYFLEMNTRLQVEHPVTELVTGIDLVEQMIRVAAGEKLRLAQKDVTLTGWAVETAGLCRRPLPQLPALDRTADQIPPAARRLRSTASPSATTPACRKAARSRSITIR